MNRKFSLLIIVLLALSVAGRLALAGEVVLEFAFCPGDVSFQHIADYEKVCLTGGCFPEDEPGTPWLPAKYVNVLIPSGATIRSVNVTGEEILLKDGIDVYPVQPPQPRSQSRGAFVPRLASVYAQNVKMPLLQGVLSGVHTMRGYQFVSIRLNPLRYIPAAQQLFLASKLQLTVVYNDPIESLRAPLRHSETFRTIVNSLVVNPEQADAAPCCETPKDAMQPRGTVDYLIITETALTNVFQMLADHRSLASMLSTKVLSMETVTNTYPGADTQMKIRNCISNYYATMGTLYVVLGGDSSIVPDRDCYVSCGEYEEPNMPTDLYYACLDGTWDADGDSIYGKPSDNVDMAWEVIVGRIPVRTAIQATDYINKLIAYEENTPDSLARKILIGGMEAWDSYTGDDRPSDDVTGDGHLDFRSASHPTVSDSEMWVRRLYRDGIRPYWSPDTIGIFCDTLTSWDTTTGGDYAQNAANLLEKFNLGWYHLFFSGHGSQIAWGLESGSFTRTDAAAMTGTTVIVYTDACLTGAFDDETYEPCLSEAFLRNTNSGAIAYMGCSRYGWGTLDPAPASDSSDGGPSTQYGYKFYKRFHESNTVCIGLAFSLHKADMAPQCSANGSYRWIQFGLNFQGDPAFGLPLTAPLITVQPQSQTNNYGASATFSVTATGSVPLYYQWQKDITNISGATGVNYSIASVQQSDEGSYRCVVTNAAGATNSASATLAVNDLPAPTGFSASDNVYTNMVLLTWDAVTYATGYEVWRNTVNDSGTAAHLPDDPTDIIYEDTSAVAGTIYYYWVKAADRSNVSAFSSFDTGYIKVIGPLIKANGQNDNVIINNPANLSITIQLDPGQYLDINVDWWVIVLAGSSWYYLDSSMQWTQFDGNLANAHPAHQGALFNLSETEVLNMTGLSIGSYKFWFAVDYPLDGILDITGPMLIDSVTVTIY